MRTFATTLKKKSEIQEYIKAAGVAGFVHRHDAPKNWDNYKALQFVISQHPDAFDEPILDAGGIEASSFLPSLQRLGYKRLIALDLSNPAPPRIISNITYKRGDITKSTYPNNFFVAVACLSVIEHGVDLNSFFSEMSRIIKPGGSLVVSTDYWADKILNPDGRQAYGVPIHIFSRDEMLNAITIAAKYGFIIPGGSIDLDCDEKTVSWMGFDYTFVICCFTKQK